MRVEPREYALPFGRDLPGGGRELRWRGAALMGVINVTPDSFSDAGEQFEVDAAVARGLQLSREGALIIDVGGESTRPGAAPLGSGEELARILPVVERLARSGTVISVDTRDPSVAEAALAAGAHMINDVGGLRLERMRQVAAQAGAPVVVMHMQGEPGTMQVNPTYRNVVSEVRDYLWSAGRAALEAGVPGVLLDPGIGFGKNTDHNLTLLRNLSALLGGPGEILIGASRKSLIGALSGERNAKRRLPGTLALHLHAASMGAALLRVHDVAAHRQALAVWEAVEDPKPSAGASFGGGTGG